jgi:hypothetical protein
MKQMTSHQDNSNEERVFGEFRRKVKSAEVLSASMERLFLSLRFTGRVSVVMRNGRVLKSGYEDRYFHQHAAETMRSRKNCRSGGRRKT